MTTELTLLAWSAGLAIVQLLIVMAGAMTQFPISVLVGNRESPIDGQGWVGRAQRAHRNMLESLLPFAVVVLVAHAAGLSTPMTVLGAQLFFFGRLIYTALYLIGVPWLRSVVWTVSLAGIVLFLVELV